ncbi:MAG: nitroreductase/quinone reductase family protein [Pseudomonadales bacterium]|jgi:deazaflavin-dependent oxidoreductase (nitroreductase family)|nr:nitroreductase/quinone reductase family protein [Pseudomonadales bacterium]
MSTQTATGPGPLALLNRLAEPAIRFGIGAPPAVPFGWWSGLVLMEIPGRKSGRLYRVPAFAFAHRDLLVVSTVRERSQWIRNLAAADRVDVWVRGRRRNARTFVWGEDHPRDVNRLRERIAFRNLGIWCDALGIRGALLALDAAAS